MLAHGLILLYMSHFLYHYSLHFCHIFREIHPNPSKSQMTGKLPILPQNNYFEEKIKKSFPRYLGFNPSAPIADITH